MWLIVRRIAFGIIFMVFHGCTPEPSQLPENKIYEPIRWKMTSTFPSSLTQLGTLGKRFSSEIDKISNGDLEIKFYEPGALAPALEGFDAVSYGAIEAGWSTPGYWAGKESALQLFGAVPFGPPAPEYLAWFYFGGGKEIFDELYARYNIKSIICGVTPPEAAGWFKAQIKQPEDFKGKKIRYFGLGGRVLEKLGASTQLLSAGDVLPALELGTIDGAEFAMPAVDYDMGFYQVARYYYFPGWHQQSTMYEVMFNMDKWNSLSPAQQAQIESVCGDNLRHGLAEGEALQFKALKQLEARGVVLENFPRPVLEALESAWKEVAQDMSNEDPDFKRAYVSLQTFRRNYKIWGERAYLK